MDFEHSGVVQMTAQQVHRGLSIRHLDDAMVAGLADPVLMIDHFEMREPVFPPHPHAGFSAVTYLFEDSEGSFQNRDSRGDRSVIRPGGLHWTVAGRGVLHEEVPITEGQRCHGLQIFFNLPAAKKLMEPRAIHLEPESIPLVRGAGVWVRVVAGEWQGNRSPADLPEPANLLDVALDGGALELRWPGGWGGVVVALRGELALRLPDGEVMLQADQCIGLRSGAEAASIEVSGRGELIILGGRALREPVLRAGPFAMDTPQRLQQAKRDHAAGRMGELAPSREYAR